MTEVFIRKSTVDLVIIVFIIIPYGPCVGASDVLYRPEGPVSMTITVSSYHFLLPRPCLPAASFFPLHPLHAEIMDIRRAYQVDAYKLMILIEAHAKINPSFQAFQEW